MREQGLNKQFPATPIKLLAYFLRVEKIKVIALMVMSILVGATYSVDSILLKNIIDTVETISDDEASTLLSVMLFWAITYGLWWEGLNFFWRLFDYLYLKAMPVIKGQVLDEFYNYIQYHNQKFFQENLAGHITNRITEGSRSLEMVFANFNEKILRKSATVVFALITMYSVHSVFATVFLIWLVIFCGLSIIFSSNINRYSNIYARNKATVAGKIVDAIANINSVRMFNSFRFERKYLHDYIDTTIESEKAMQWFMLKLRYVLGLSTSVMIFAMLYYLSLMRGQLLITAGDYVLIITLCIAVVGDIWDLTQEIGDMFEELGSFTQSISLLEPYLITDSTGSKELKVIDGTIEFKNVTFYYRHNDNIFSNKSIIIPGRQKVGLVGYSGSGKSTFVNLISRSYDIESGTILIDGQDIRNVTQESLREHISIIPQEPILFHRTIIENIRYGKKSASDEEVIEAAKKAHAHEFIINLPEKYDTLCGERGNNLSGGQRQRIAIARAILKNAPILILDEATSSLDTLTENLIQQSLQYLMRNKTVLVIAHRLSTLLNMDRIIVFDKGSIVENGTHKELLASNNLYYKLWNSQVRGFIAESPDSSE